MGITRLVGPLSIGISLAVKSFGDTCYRVNYSVHNLAYVKDSMVAGLSMQSSPFTIGFCEHKELCKKSCSYLKEKALILEGEISLEDIFNAYNKEHKLTHGEAGVPAIVAVWVGASKSERVFGLGIHTYRR